MGRIIFVIVVWYAALGGPAVARIDFATAAYGGQGIVEPEFEALPASGDASLVLENPGDQASLVNEIISLQLAGSHPEGGTLTYSADGLPPGISLIQTTGSVTGRPSTAGTYPVVVSVSDGVLIATAQFMWSVTGDAADRPTRSRAPRNEVAGSSAPRVTAPIPVSPIGAIRSDKPSFTWYPARGAVSYVLVIDDSAGVERMRMTVPAPDARCAITKTCTFSPGVSLPPGEARWTVEGVAVDGDGVWSDQRTFTVPDKTAPTIQVTTPSLGAYETTERSMNIAGTASDNAAVTSIVWSSSRGASGTAAGTTRWNAVVALQPGINRITVTARDASGNMSRESVAAVYVVPTTPLSPRDASASAPSFVWTAVPATSRYVLRVEDSTHADKVLVTVTPFEAGCESGPTCTVNPGVTLASGSAQWSVEAIALSDLHAWSAPMAFSVDATAPTLQIVDRAPGKKYRTSSGEIRLSGFADDDLAVARVIWIDDRGGGGIATGTSQWVTDTIALREGTTTFTVAAVDGDGQSASETITVTYTPAPATRGRR